MIRSLFSPGAFVTLAFVLTFGLFPALITMILTLLTGWASGPQYPILYGLQNSLVMGLLSCYSISETQGFKQVSYVE